MIIVHNSVVVAQIGVEELGGIEEVVALVLECIKDTGYYKVSVLLDEEESCIVFRGSGKAQYRKEQEITYSDGSKHKVQIAVSGYRYVYPLEKGFDGTFWI
ncbi:MAG: hypothetical protein RML94_00185 [Bacteroidia bacterium]|nr:hypothetical protein [Bacteroidia bacterium]